MLASLWHRVYGAVYGAQVPFALFQNDPTLLMLDRQSYIDSVLKAASEGIEIPSFTREESDDFVRRLMANYGGDITIETALAARKTDRPNVLDGIPKTSNVQYAKSKGLYVVGLSCTVESQVERVVARALQGKKAIDSVDREEVARQVARTSAFFELPDALSEAHVVYNTNERRSDSPEIVEAILARIS